MNDRELMCVAIEEAEKSQPEDGQPRPRVGVVFARDGAVIAKAYRNEDGQGSHAEFLALKKIESAGLSAEGAAVYTTLEPCVHRKSKNKIPCARRLADAKVARVIYGIIDPHKTVQSKGLLQLRTHQIPVESFDADLSKKIEDLNVAFLRAFTVGEASAEFVENNRGRRLDDWYRTVNRIYWRQNLGRSPADLFGHLAETIGVISLLGTGKKKPGVDPPRFVIKAIAWWLSLCGRLRVRSVEETMWAKFPGVCSYCRKVPHADECSGGSSPDWLELRSLGSNSIRPGSLGAWQRMFRNIYPRTLISSAEHIYARLTEELGELAEAIRVFEFAPGLFLNEAPDVLAWILQIQNAIEKDSLNPGDALERAFCAAYPDLCPYCAAEVCQCPAILPSTVGRLGGAIPPTNFILDGRRIDAFMAVDGPPDLFEL